MTFPLSPSASCIMMFVPTPMVRKVEAAAAGIHLCRSLCPVGWHTSAILGQLPASIAVIRREPYVYLHWCHQRYLRNNHYFKIKYSVLWGLLFGWFWDLTFCGGQLLLALCSERDTWHSSGACLLYQGFEPGLAGCKASTIVPVFFLQPQALQW